MNEDQYGYGALGRTTYGLMVYTSMGHITCSRLVDKPANPGHSLDRLIETEHYHFRMLGADYCR